MNIDTTIDGKKVTIELTTNQIDSIKAQTSGYQKYTDIKSVDDAVKHLRNLGHTIDIARVIPVTEKIRWFAMAVNSLINNKSFPNWKDDNERKHFPYFIYKNGNWVFDGSCCYYSGSVGQPGFYKTEEASIYAAKTIPELYTEVCNQTF